VLFAKFCFPSATAAQTIPTVTAIDADVRKIMTSTRANEMAVAVIDHAKIDYVRAYGSRNAKGDPLTTDTIMYGIAYQNDVVKFILGHTDVPYDWEYGDHAGKS